eukprot:gene7083-8791_t
MGNKLYVGNLPYSVTNESLQSNFGEFGDVTSAKVMMDRDTGRSKGFGFVEMGSDAEAQAAINGMNGQPLGGRSVVVNEARPMEARPPRSGGGGGYGGGGGGGLESESLGDLVSKREYNKMKHSISKYVDYTTLPVFNKQTAPYAASKGTGEVASCMQRLVPTSLDANTVGRITSPEDLKTITAA